MYPNGHRGISLGLFAPVALLLVHGGFTPLAVLGGLVVVGLARLPDKDQNLPFVKHRGITHTVWFALVVGLVVGAGCSVVAEVAGLDPLLLFAFGTFAGAYGIVGHILGDVITPAGVRPFAPLRSTKYSFGVVKAANPIANYLFLAVGGSLYGAALLYGGRLPLLP